MFLRVLTVSYFFWAKPTVLSKRRILGRFTRSKKEVFQSKVLGAVFEGNKSIYIYWAVTYRAGLNLIHLGYHVGNLHHSNSLSSSFERERRPCQLDQHMIIELEEIKTRALHQEVLYSSTFWNKIFGKFVFLRKPRRLYHRTL